MHGSLLGVQHPLQTVQMNLESTRAVFKTKNLAHFLLPLGHETAMNRVIFENKLELITFTLDGHLLHTHKTNFVQRHSLEIWPDFESAKKAFESASGQIRWGEPEQ